MRHRPNVRFLLLIPVALVIGAALFAASAFTQQSTQERAVWDVQMARNAQATSTITLQNQCKQTHTFTVTEQETPFLHLLAAPTVNVPGNNSYNLPVQFNTNGMNAAQYQGTVVVKCDTCRKEKTCKQDREILPVRLTVLPENGPEMTPGETVKPPVIAGPPDKMSGATGDHKGGGMNLTIALDGQEFDKNGKKVKDYANIPFSDDVQNPCKKQSCPKLKTTKSGKIYCQEIDNCGGKDCPTAGCHMLIAWADPKDPNIPKSAKDPEKWRSTGAGVAPKEIPKDKDPDFYAIKPEPGKVYGCGCH